ncbi:MAG: diacylglycerol kinase [Myxococcota bacterium]|nr:diacylglycerol kinase [Myxococcota bacterium]
MKGDASPRARARSFRFAFRGLALLAREPNAWIHAAATAAVAALALGLGVGARDGALLALAVGLVWTAEAMNTALEAACDAAAPRVDPRVARAKDLAAGAVLLAALGAVAVGLLVLGPPLLARLASA